MDCADRSRSKPARLWQRLKRLWPDISLPWSHVRERRSCSGNLRMCLASAATTVVVSFLGSLTSIVKRAVAFDERHDVRVACSGKKISFPMARNCAILGTRRVVSRIETSIEYVPLSILCLAAFGVTHLPRLYATVPISSLLQHAARLNKETAIDRFVGYPHVSVGRELLLQPARDLLWRPLQRKLLRHAPS